MRKPTPFEVARDRLRNEITILHDLWSQYTYLFHDADRVQMLNACAAWFFGTVQRCMMREVILGISRLTDPPASGKHSNLVIASLLNDVKLRRRKGTLGQIEAAIADAIKAAENIRKHRHKYIAHLDHASAISATEDLVPRIKLGEIGTAINAIGGAYKLHASKVTNTDVSFSLHSGRSAAALVEALEGSERWRQWQEWNKAGKNRQ